jgi:hypothetical protein
MTGKLRVPRSRGAVSGTLLVLLGVWGGLIAFVGPYFHYAYNPASAWTYTTGRLWLEILPGAGAAVGGLVVLVSTLRPIALLGAWVAAVSGAWFAVGGILMTVWAHGAAASAGTPAGGTTARAVEQLGFFAGLGVVIVFVAAAALGKLTVLAHRDVRAASGKHVASGTQVDSGTQGASGKAQPIRTTVAASSTPAVRSPLRAAGATWRRIGSVKKATPGSAGAEDTEPVKLNS